MLRGFSLLLIDPALDARGAGLLAFMVFYGLDWVATVPPTVAICIDQFGTAGGPLVYGWVFAGHQIGRRGGGLGCRRAARHHRVVPPGVHHLRRLLHRGRGLGDAHPAPAGARASAGAGTGTLRG